MTVNDIAKRVLTYFPPEMRGIPDAVAYPGPNAAVLNAINGALQEVAQLGAPWFGFDERQTLVNEPATIEMSLTLGSATAIVSTDDWESWMEGCAAIIPGALAPNRIRKATYVEDLDVITITGTLSPDATGDLNRIVGDAYASTYPEGSAWRSGTGDGDPPETGSWVVLYQSYLSLPAATTLDALLPPDTAGLISGSGLIDNPSTISVVNFELGDFRLYYLKLVGDDPLWYELLEDVPAGSVELPAGHLVYPLLEPAGDRIPFPAGLGATYEASPTAEWLWTLLHQTIDPAALLEWVHTGPTPVGTYEPVSPSTGTATATVGAEWQIDLVGAHHGATGILPVTIYHDAVYLGSDVLKIHPEAYLSGEPITHVGDIRQARVRRSPSRDYGMSGAGMIVSGSATLDTGRPVNFSAEAWRTGSTVEHRRLLRLAPAPTGQHILDLRVSVVPPEVTSLASTALLPIPFQFIESTFLPIVLFHLQDCPWFLRPEGDMASKYAAARESIKGGNPAGNASPRFKFKG